MTPSARILIVDDEPNVRLMFCTALETSGYVVEVAVDGEKALEQVKKSTYDLILLDLQMPRMSGIETLRLLREQGHEVPVVIVTAHGSVPDAVAALRLGAIDFLSKPLTPGALRNVVAEVVERHSVPRKAKAASISNKAVLFTESMAMAKTALNRRDFHEGETLLKDALTINPASPEAHNLLGVLHELRDEHDSSYREYRASLKADSNYLPAKQNMTRYYERFTYGRTSLPLNPGE